MAQEEHPEKKRAKTYAPIEQVELWDEEADKMGITRSEYMRFMIQAGRRQFPICNTDNGGSDGIDIENRVLSALDEHGELTWDELIEETVGDIEEAIEDTIEELDEDGTVSISLRNNTISLR